MIKPHRKKAACWAAVIVSTGFVILNISAYFHASKMLVFSDSGIKTRPVDELSFRDKALLVLTGTNIPKPQNNDSPKGKNLSFLTSHVTTSDGIDLECWFLTKAKPSGTVLMLHGYAGCKSSLLPEAEYFYRKGYNVLMPDFRASGGSQGNMTSIGYYEAIDVKACYDLIMEEYSFGQPVIIYGQSMGGAAALRAISVYGIKPDKLIIESVFDTMLSAVGNRFRIAGAPAFPAAHILTFWGGVKLGNNSFTHNPRTYAAGCSMPVLLLQGTEDRKVTLGQANELFSRFKSPKTMVTFEGAAHGSLFKADSGKWAASVDAFLESKP